ncbi:hypothetical protein RBA41_31395 [Massilia sp. CCM 9210]|uniref:hypothetical protein n=1 Tax=Massilia scottii TaxID=3057166 RepID=UPI002796B260|nr:hypothetical protein [Massilia sp. CCM 9210]MDQ1817816.1 hypothetical protein [Massilia sp. CCM 9210]
MKKSGENMMRKTVRFGVVLGIVFVLTACAQKPVLKQLDPDTPETPVNSPAQADAIRKAHSK